MKKKLKFITFQLILLLFASFISCSSNPNKSPDTSSLKKGTLVAPVKLEGKWGLMTNSGEWVIKPTSDFTDIKDFHEGLALACYKGEEWGYISPYGEWVIEPKFKFSGYEPSSSANFKEGYALLQETDRDYGYIDKSGEYIIKPQFVSASPFNEGVAAFLCRNYDSTYEFINPKGEVLLKIEDENVYEIVSDFSEDLLAKENDKGKMGFINIKGEWIIPPIYQITYPFKEGLAYVETKNGNGFINKNGEKVIDLKYNTSIEFNEGYAFVISTENNKRGVIDKDGNLVIPFKYDKLGDFHEGILSYKSGGKWGYFDTTGTKITQPKFEYVSNFVNGLAPVYLNDKWGVIDKKGDLIIDAKFDCIRSFVEIK